MLRTFAVSMTTMNVAAGILLTFAVLRFPVVPTSHNKPSPGRDTSTDESKQPAGEARDAMIDWKKYLSYDPETGVFVWLVRPESDFDKPRFARAWNARYAGKRAGSICGTYGYLIINVHNRHYRASRIAWEMCRGRIPTGLDIDHMNGIRNDDRLCNLRPATRSQNMCNRHLQKNNTSGYPGVQLTESGTWAAKIKINRKEIHLGCFRSWDDAVAARVAAEARVFGEFSRTNKPKENDTI